MYKVEFTQEALEQLRGLDKHTSMIIVAWVRRNLEGCENPYRHGKGIAANQSGQWRYRIGDYRLLVTIQKEKIIVLRVTVNVIVNK